MRGIFWTQKRGSERSMVLRGIFEHKGVNVRVGWC